MRNCCPGIDLCRRFVKTYESVIPEPQLGDSLFMSGMLLGGYCVNAIITKFLTILKIQPNKATLRSDQAQAVR